MERDRVERNRTKVTICVACNKATGSPPEDIQVALAAFLLPEVRRRAGSAPCPFRGIDLPGLIPLDVAHSAAVVTVHDELRRAYRVGELPEGPE